MSLFDGYILRRFSPAKRELKFSKKKKKSWLVLKMCKPGKPTDLVTEPAKLFLIYDPENHGSCCSDLPDLQCKRQRTVKTLQ